MENKKSPNDNVLHFPGRKIEPSKVSPEGKNKEPKGKTSKSSKGGKNTVIGTVLAIAFFTATVNGYVFRSASSLESASQSRGLASVDGRGGERNEDWEKVLVRKLAAPKARGVASDSIGRSPTAIEKLRFGTLEEKYTITYREDAPLVRAVSLQGSVSTPAYVQDRRKFLSHYGHLMSSKFASSNLESVQTADGKTIEIYTLFDDENKVSAQALFELDRHSRLISLKVEPVQI